MKADFQSLKDKPPVKSANRFPVVGIGASAGGLEAFTKFIKAIPPRSGMAYVLVQHMNPTHESLLPELLQKVTDIPVTEIVDEVKVVPNHIYIIPSNTMLMANDGVLQLSPRPVKTKSGLNLPIDLFFESLADVHQSHAIGVVLSGTASDGTQGLKAIKEHGGITFAQDKASAAFNGMPQSAIDAGVVDFVLKPEDIPKTIFEIKQQLDRTIRAQEKNPDQNENYIRQILFILRLRKGTDFSDYKRPTILRRVFRRMMLNKKGNYDDYIKFLAENKAEQDALYQDLLIPVTSFFRDAHVFETLCVSLFPKLIKSKEANEVPLRLWIAACSSGEEAYSMAMCLHEYFSATGEKLQIFATDINEAAIEKARSGMYSNKEVEGVSPERLKMFFTKTAGGYRVNKPLREICVFAVHNFLKDPPFSKMDLVSCRNVLIYMESYLQNKALTNFHYALNPKGYLLLGKAETAGIVPELFAVAEKNDKLYSRKDGPAKFIHVVSSRSEENLQVIAGPYKKEKMHTDFTKTVDEIVLNDYSPACVVVNDALDIVHFRGNTSRYLEQASGKPSHNLLRMAKSGLGFELRNLLLRFKKENTGVKKENIRMNSGDALRIVNIEIISIPDLADPHYMVLFHDADLAVLDSVKKIVSQKDKENVKDLRILQLEKELVQNLADMHNISEEQENANNELQSANEELLSGSEELQSLNEELETSKEELQSTNEELTVLNQELISLNEQLHNAISEQEIVKRKLDIQALMVRNLLMTAPGFICTMTGPDHVYDLVNARYQELFGKRKIQGLPLMKALPELAGQGFEELLNQVYTTGVPYVGIESMSLLARDEGLEPENRYFNFSYQPIFDEHKNVISILVFGYEVTDQVNAKKLMVEVHEKHSIELEHQVLQRTIELIAANEGLVEKNREIANNNKELESFTYISSHDLQEPLRKIQMFATAIEANELERLSDTGKDHFRRMHRAAEQMQTLIRDLLAYSRTNVTEHKFEETDLALLLEDLEKEFAETLKEKNGTIEINHPGKIKVIPFQFYQLFQNLIANSLKFSRSGIPVRISVTGNMGDMVPSGKNTEGLLQEEEKKAGNTGKYFHIRFADNGIGFDPVYSTKIFEVFQRLHGKQDYPGTGIGLAIVKKIVENHHGFITATGVLGEGAIFDIYIPFEKIKHE